MLYEVITDFSGVERFIDTPVKRYSSGMTVGETWNSWLEMNPETAEHLHLEDEDIVSYNFV